MAPATITDDGGVRVPIDEHTRAVAELAAVRAVQEHMAHCPIVAAFREMHQDFYGVAGEKEEHPGALGDMAACKKWQKEFETRVDKHIGRIWKVVAAVAASVAGAVASWCLANWHSLAGRIRS